MSDLLAPFRGERYAAAERLGALIAPPYDVIDQAERARYAALAAENIVHVMLPEAPPAPPRRLRRHRRGRLRAAPHSAARADACRTQGRSPGADARDRDEHRIDLRARARS